MSVNACSTSVFGSMFRSAANRASADGISISTFITQIIAALATKRNCAPVNCGKPLGKGVWNAKCYSRI